MAQKLIKLIDIENAGEEITLCLSKEDAARALNDMTFATSLMHKYRKYLIESSQRKNNLQQKDFKEPSRGHENIEVLQENNKTYKQLQMIDEVTNKDYLLNVPEHMYERAIKDKVYAKSLLEKTTNSLKENIIYEDKVMNNKESEESDEDILKKRSKWDNTETTMLINLYKEKDGLIGKISNKRIWTDIARGMKSYGYSYNAAQCCSKMDTLKRKYRNIRDHNSRSGNSRKDWEHYEALDETFNKKAWIQPLSTAGSNLPLNENSSLLNSPIHKHRSKINR